MFKVTDLMLHVIPRETIANGANLCICTDGCTWPTCFPSCMFTFDPSKDAPPCEQQIRNMIGPDELGILKASLKLHQEKVQNWEQVLDSETLERAEVRAEELIQSVGDLGQISERFS